MNTIVVWVLVVIPYIGVSPAVVDNIASQANCQALGKAIVRGPVSSESTTGEFQCIAVRKVKP